MVPLFSTFVPGRFTTHLETINSDLQRGQAFKFRSNIFSLLLNFHSIKLYFLLEKKLFSFLVLISHIYHLGT